MNVLIELILSFLYENGVTKSHFETTRNSDQIEFSSNEIETFSVCLRYDNGQDSRNI